MNRKSHSINLIDDALNIDISDLKRNGFIVKEDMCRGTLYFKDKAGNDISVGFTIYNYITQKTCYLNLNSLECKIDIVELDSNLGKGKILFFKCPLSGQLCRKIYKIEGHNSWGSNSAFNERLYYKCQVCSKLQKYSVSYENYETLLMKYKKVNATYRGKPTKSLIRLRKIRRRRDLMSLCMISPLAFPKRMRHLFPAGLETQVKEHLAFSLEI